MDKSPSLPPSHPMTLCPALCPVPGRLTPLKAAASGLPGPAASSGSVEGDGLREDQDHAVLIHSGFSTSCRASGFWEQSSSEATTLPRALGWLFSGSLQGSLCPLPCQFPFTLPRAAGGRGRRKWEEEVGGGGRKEPCHLSPSGPQLTHISPCSHLQEERGRKLAPRGSSRDDAQSG